MFSELVMTSPGTSVVIGCLAEDLLVFVLMNTVSWSFGGRIPKDLGLCGSRPNL